MNDLRWLDILDNYDDEHPFSRDELPPDMRQRWDELEAA